MGCSGVPGETFRWVFVTSTKRDATSSLISAYNTFVNAVADTTNTSITGVQGKETIGDIDWDAIASVPAVDARDNIGSTGSGIYTPLGVLVASNTADLFDGALSYYINVTECGDLVPSNYQG